MTVNDIEQEVCGCVKCSRLRNITPIPYSHIYYGDINNIKMFVLDRNPKQDLTEYKDYNEFVEHYKTTWWGSDVCKYLKKMFGENFIKQSVFYTTVCKCSTPNNTLLNFKEKRNCFHFLQEQIDVVKPKVIVAFYGKTVFINNMKGNKYKDIPVYFLDMGINLTDKDRKIIEIKKLI